MPHEAVITSTVATRHYGVTANAIYRESEDAGQEKIRDKYEGIYRVRKMTWYILRVRDGRFQSVTLLSNIAIAGG